MDFSQIEDLLRESRSHRAAVQSLLESEEASGAVDQVMSNGIGQFNEFLCSIENHVLKLEEARRIASSWIDNDYQLPDAERSSVEQFVEDALEEGLQSIQAAFDAQLSPINSSIDDFLNDFSDRFDDVKDYCESFVQTLQEGADEAETFVIQSTERLLNLDSELIFHVLTELSLSTQNAVESLRADLVSCVREGTDKIEIALQAVLSATTDINDKFENIEKIIGPVEPIVEMIQEVRSL